LPCAAPDAAQRDDLIELIETVIMYKLVRLNRQEIQAMLDVHDIRKSRVYQEALEEGEKKGEQKGEQKATARYIANLAAKKMSPEQIASSLEVEIELVREVLKSSTNG
jgi:predicted transposase/invertase (TIGR01784 family)